MSGFETAIINRVHTDPLRGGLLEGWYEKEYYLNALQFVKLRQHVIFLTFM